MTEEHCKSENPSAPLRLVADPANLSITGLTGQEFSLILMGLMKLPVSLEVMAPFYMKVQNQYFAQVGGPGVPPDPPVAQKE